MDKRDLHSEIIEILVLTQFNLWVDPPKEIETATQVNERKQRAIDYFLGKSDPNKSAMQQLADIEQVKFHSIISLQASAIMKAIKMAEEHKEK